MAKADPPPRQAIRALGIAAARKVRAALGYEDPSTIEIEVLAYMRGALVRPTPAKGARANLMRIGERGMIGVADGLTLPERRWAIAHELGHFETHPGLSFVDLCEADDMLPSYQASGREPEANAFAAELLMPEDLFRPACDIAKVSWIPIRKLAERFGVSETAAALRFLAFTEERAAVVCMKNGRVIWASASKEFGNRPRKDTRVAEWTEAYDFFSKGKCSERPETVSASAWIEDADEDKEIVEHVTTFPTLGVAISLLWWKPE